MKQLLSILFAAAAFLAPEDTVLAQTAPVQQWDKTFGGTGSDYLRYLNQTSDGGYLLGGSSGPAISGDKTQGGKGLLDFWVIKTDGSGNKAWDKTYGGNGDDLLTFLQQTPDGGFILGGGSKSGISGDKSQPANGDDYWIIKTDSAGNKVWDKTFGGSDDDGLSTMALTSDGGYILCGSSKSPVSGSKTEASRGGLDFWLVKTDSLGNKMWDKTLGGSQTDQPWFIQQTSDGGYIVGGNSYSGINGDKNQASFGYDDYWIIKLDASGNKVWDKTFGGDGREMMRSLKQTADGGYILAGHSNSGVSGNKTTPTKGSFDFWAIKLDANGIKTWEKGYGGSSAEDLWEVLQSSDGGYVLAGYSYSDSNGDKSEPYLGKADCWILKIDTSGNKLWDKTFGGNGFETIVFFKQTKDNGYILGGYSDSGITATKSQASKGSYDFWVIKLAGNLTGINEFQTDLPISIFPNPNQGKFKLQLNNFTAPKADVTVTDLLGRVVLKREIKTIDKQILEELTLPAAKGMYLLQVKVTNQITTRKIVVE